MRFLSLLLLLSAVASPVRAQSTAGNPDGQLSQAAELARTKDYAGAEKLYRQALATAPEDPEVLKALGAVCQAQGKYDESVQVFQKVLKRAPVYPGVNLLLGISYYALNNFEGTLEATRKELAGNPSDRQARYYMALALSASGRLFEAIQQLEALLAEDSGNPNPAVLYQLVVDYKAATQRAGERLGKLYPDSEFNHAMNAEVYGDNNRFDEAILEFKEVLRKDPSFPGVHFGLGQVYWRKKDYDNAVQQLTLALEEEPQQPLANYYMADILTGQSAFQQAIPHLQITITAYPQLTRAYFLLGKCYTGTGDLHRALDAFNKALEQDPKYLEVHYQLHEIYARLGDKEKSEAHLNTFERLTKEGQDKDRTLLQENLQKQTEAKRQN